MLSDDSLSRAPRPSSLQGRLDEIAYGRAVLDRLRELAALGLREGDAVRHERTGVAGRIVIDRRADGPVTTILTEQTSVAEFTIGEWRPVASS